MSVCPECGTNEYHAKLWERYADEASRLRREYEHQAAKHAVEAATWRLQELERVEDRKGLQRKVRAQSGVIKDLEDKLRSLGVRPYSQLAVTVTE